MHATCRWDGTVPESAFPRIRVPAVVLGFFIASAAHAGEVYFACFHAKEHTLYGESRSGPPTPPCAPGDSMVRWTSAPPIDPVSGRYRYEEAVEAPGIAAEELRARALRFAAGEFTDRNESRSVVPDAGGGMGRIVTPCSVYMLTGLLHFLVTLEIEDQRFRFTLQDFVVEHLPFVWSELSNKPNTFYPLEDRAIPKGDKVLLESAKNVARIVATLNAAMRKSSGPHEVVLEVSANGAEGCKVVVEVDLGSDHSTETVELPWRREVRGYTGDRVALGAQLDCWHSKQKVRFSWRCKLRVRILVDGAEVKTAQGKGGNAGAFVEVPM